MAKGEIPSQGIVYWWTYKEKCSSVHFEWRISGRELEAKVWPKWQDSFEDRQIRLPFQGHQVAWESRQETTQGSCRLGSFHFAGYCEPLGGSRIEIVVLPIIRPKNGWASDLISQLLYPLTESLFASAIKVWKGLSSDSRTDIMRRTLIWSSLFKGRLRNRGGKWVNYNLGSWQAKNTPII